MIPPLENFFLLTRYENSSRKTGTSRPLSRLDFDHFIFTIHFQPTRDRKLPHLSCGHFHFVAILHFCLRKSCVQFLLRVKRRDRVEGNIAENLNCNRIKYGFALLEIIANS